MPIDRLFASLSESPSAKGALSGAASGAMVSMLMKKKARKALGKGAVQLGGMAALAGVGYMAYKKWQDHKQQAGASAGSPAPTHGLALLPNTPPAPDAAAPAVSDSLGMKILLVMIAAAHADGTIDPAEMDALFQSIQEANLSPEENCRITAALNNPPDLPALTQDIAGPEEAAEVYGAALMAIDPDTPAEQFFLRRLAHALSLDPPLVEAIHLQARAES